MLIKPPKLDATPKRYFVKKTTRYNTMRDKFEEGRHNKCGGKPEWLNIAKNIFHCAKCRREFLPPKNATTHYSVNLNTYFYVEKDEEVFPEKLEPVWKYKDVTDGRVMYGKLFPLNNDELVAHYFSGKQIITK